MKKSSIYRRSKKLYAKNGNGSKMHEKSFLTKTSLLEGTKLHEENFAQKVNFARTN